MKEINEENFRKFSKQFFKETSSCGFGWPRQRIRSWMSPYLIVSAYCCSTSYRRLNDGTHRAVRFHLLLYSRHDVREQRVPLFIRVSVCDNARSPLQNASKTRGTYEDNTYFSQRISIWLTVKLRVQLHRTLNVCKDEPWEDREKFINPFAYYRFFRFRWFYWELAYKCDLQYFFKYN